MDFALTEDQLAVRDMVRQFAKEEIAPGVVERDRLSEFPHAVLRRAGELGLCGMSVPEEWSGSALDTVSYCLALQEIARVCPSTAVTLSVTNSVCAQPIHRFGTDEQRERYLRRLATGEWLGGFMLTEPGSGSDASAMKTRARRDGDDWILDGSKAWVTNAEVARVFVAFARTGDGPKEISAFILDGDAAGLSLTRMEDKMGLRASHTGEYALEGVRVPGRNLLGREGKGLEVAFGSLDRGRLGIASQALGMAEGSFEAARKHARVRHAFGGPIGDLQAIQWMLADMHVRLEASRMLLLRAATAAAAGKLKTRDASMAKLACTENAQWICDRSVQIHGGTGYSRESVAERMYRDVRVTTIYEGTSQIQQLVIARDLLRS